MTSAFYKKIYCIFFITTFLATPSAGTAQNFSEIDTFVQNLMETVNAPGLAVAIVKHDKVLFMKGYGTRKFGENWPVNKDTIFNIASTTKAFTGAAVGLLVQNDIAKFDDPIITHIPEFRVKDPYVSTNLTLRDTLTHRSGLDNTNLLWYPYFERSSDQILSRLKNLESKATLRNKLAYNNVMYLLAGEVVGRASNSSWAEYIEDNLFLPLEMNRSKALGHKVSAYEDNIVTPHIIKRDGTPKPLPWKVWENMAPAGSITSTISDMSHWVQMWLGKGRYDGKQILNTDTFSELLQPQVVTRYTPERKLTWGDAQYASYAMGWNVTDYHGEKSIYHLGGIDGMSSVVAFLPDQDIGLVVLTNVSSRLVVALRNRIFDIALEREETDWVEEFTSWNDKNDKRFLKAIEAVKSKKKSSTKPSVPLNSYVGEFENTLIGKLSVVKNGKKIALKRGSEEIMDLTHWHNDVFRRTSNDPMLSGLYPDLLHFILSIDGTIEAVVFEDRRYDRIN